MYLSILLSDGTTINRFDVINLMNVVSRFGGEVKIEAERRKEGCISPSFFQVNIPTYGAPPHSPEYMKQAIQ